MPFFTCMTATGSIVPAGGNQFKRTEVRAGEMLGGNRQEILSGLEPGQQVVTNALLLETAGNQ